MTRQRLPISAIQSPAASSRRSIAPRRREPLGPVSPRRPAAARRARLRGGGGRGRRGGLPALGVGRAAHPQPSQPSRRQVSSGFSRSASAQVGAGRGDVARLVLDLASAGSRGASCGPRGGSPARGARRRSRSRPGARRAGRAGRRARRPRARSSGPCRRGRRRSARSPSAAADWLASISRSTSSGPISARAVIQAIARPATARPKRRCSALAVGGGPRARASWAQRAGDQDAAGEEEDRAERGDLPEPVDRGADREGQARGEQGRVQLALPAPVPPARPRSRSRAGSRPGPARAGRRPAPARRRPPGKSEWASCTGTGIERSCSQENW